VVCPLTTLPPGWDSPPLPPARAPLPLRLQNNQLHSSNHYARMSDEYGGHVDQAQYPRGSPYRKNPAIIDSYDPNEKPAKPGEGARVSDAYGAHYRDKNYVVPRGGVALSAHGIPEPVDATADAENRARGTRSVAAQEAARREGASKLVGGIDYRGDHPEEYGKFYTNGYDFEGYYQGHHAGKKVASSFSGAGMHHKDVSDPYENFRGPVNKLEQKPMPKHNDMDVGVLAYMAPQNREVAMKPTSTAASDRLRRYGESQKILQGKGLGDADELSERLKKVGVAKNVAGPSQLARPSAKAIKALVPEKQEGQYDGGRTMKAKGVYSKAANAGNIEVGSVNGMVARADAQFDGIFDVNRVGTREQRADQKSNIGFKDGSLVADREGAYDGIFENTAEGYRNKKTDYPQDALKSSIGVGMTGTREGTYEGIFENPEEGYRNRGVGDRPVEAPAKAAMQWGAERSKGRTDEGEGVFAEGHKMRGGFAGKDTESALGPGMSFVDDSKIDEGIFNANRKIQHSGKDGETAFGPGFSLAPDKVDDGIFAEGRTSRFAGKDNESNIEVGPGGYMPSRGAAKDGVFQEGRTNKFAGLDNKSSLRAGPGGFYGDKGAINEGIFNEDRRLKHAGKDGETGIGPGFIPKREAASDGIFAEGRVMQHGGRDGATGLGPGMIPTKEAASDGIFAEDHRLAGGFAGKDTESAIGSDMMGREDQQQREAFAGAYSEMHADKDTESHFDPGMIPQVQWKGGSGAQAAYERRKQLSEYYSAAAKATAEGKKLNFYDRKKNEEQPAAGMAANRFSRGGNTNVRTQKTSIY